MHNVIIQMADAPIDKDSYIEESDYYESWFLGGVADYVETLDDEERDQTIKDLHNEVGFTPCDDGGFIIDKTKRTEQQYTMLCDKMKETLERDKNDVIEDLDAILSEIQGIISNRVGAYVEYEGTLYTMSRFIRLHHGEKFYPGGVVGYHV